MKTNNNFSNVINSIVTILSSRADSGTVVKQEKAAKTASYCRGSIALYRAAELERARKDPAYKASPFRLYTFYPSTIDAERIGSIAIYGDEVGVLYSQIRATGTLFGLPVANVCVKQGRRPFVDVTLKE